MNRAPILCAVLTLWPLAGCLTDLSTPPGADIRCSADDDTCPSPLVCARAAGRCVDPGLVNLDALTLSITNGGRARMSHVAPFDTSTVVVELNREPGSFEASIQGAIVQCDGLRDGDVFMETCTFTTPDSPETVDGSNALDLFATDEVGGVVSDSAPFVIDTTAPALVQELTTFEYAPGDNNPRRGSAVASSTLGTRVRVGLTFSEVLAAAPIVTVGSATLQDLGPPPPASSFAAAFDDDGSLADGPLSVHVVAVDDVGNADALDTAAQIVIDHTAPSAPDVESELVLLVRAPWGEPRDSGAGGRVFSDPHVEVTGAAGAVAEDVRQLRAFVSGRPVGDGDALPDGSFSAPLIAADARLVDIEAYDDAGNGSGPVGVKNVEWIASFGGKVAGSTFENPHQAFTTPELGASVLGATLEETQTPDALTTGDNSALTVVVGRSWKQIVPSRIAGARARALFVWDSARAVAVLSCGSLVSARTSDTVELVDDRWLPRSIVSPPDRTDVGGAYDARRGRVVMFGGSVGAGISNEVWELDGSAWTRRPDADAPPRSAPAMAYDVNQAVTVVFGGSGSGQLLGDTWFYDGTTWTELGGAGPPARRSAAVAWDDARGRMVLMGGAGDAGELDDTWALTNGVWEQLGSGPSARQGAAMTFDPVSGGVLLFGGRAVDGSFDPGTSQLWRLDGDVWTLVDQGQGPRPDDRLLAHMATDTSRGRVLLFGGLLEDAGAVSGAEPVTGDTWEWTGSAWRQLAPTDGALSDIAPAAVAFDPALGQLISFGGLAAGAGVAVFNDTFALDGERWRNTSPPSFIPPAIHAAMGRFAGQLFLVFSGGESYRWSGSDWAATNIPGPPVSSEISVAPDGASRALLTASGLVDESWLFNGNGWTQVCNENIGDSCPRAGALASDEDRGLTVAVDADGTWEWDGLSWTLRAIAQPPFNAGAQLAWNPDRHTVMLVGGQGGLDTWEYDGVTWHELSVVSPPPGRSDAGLAYDESVNALTLVGGNVGGRTAGETWRLKDAGRPSVVLRFALGAAGRGAGALTSIDVAGIAGGTGPGGDGVEMLAWTRGRFITIASGAGSPSGPTELAGSVPGDELRRLPFANDDALFFAVQPVHGDERGGVRSTVSLDEVVARVSYRLP